MSLFAAQDTTPRRGFLGRLTAGTMAMMGVAAAAPSALEAESFLGSPADEWLNGLTGTYRQFFDAVSVNEGFPFSFAMTFMNTIGETYKVADKDINAVVGLRHFAIPLAFNNDIWAKYKLGEMFKVNDPVTKAPAVRNPYAYAKEGELLFPGMAFEKIQARGAIFTVCNVALTVLSGMAAGFAGQPKESAKQDWLSGMFKGVNVVPSGVFAVNRAQKKGCTYCYAG
jgi:hypothetical protein